MSKSGYITRVCSIACSVKLGAELRNGSLRTESLRNPNPKGRSCRDFTTNGKQKNKACNNPIKWIDCFYNIKNMSAHLFFLVEDEGLVPETPLPAEIYGRFLKICYLLRGSKYQILIYSRPSKWAVENPADSRRIWVKFRIVLCKRKILLFFDTMFCVLDNVPHTYFVTH